MSTSSDQVFDSALALSDSERADLAFQLLQSLVPPGEEITTEQFGIELHQRIEARRRGEIKSLSLEETRAVVIERLSQERTK